MRVGFAVIELGSSLDAHKIFAHRFGGLPWRVELPIGVVDFDQPLQIAPDLENPQFQIVEMILVDPLPAGNVTVLGEEFQISAQGHVDVIREYAILPDPTPDTITKLALRNVLSDMGRWAEFKAFLEANPDIKEVWELASDVNRNHELTPVVKDAFNLTDEQVDYIFREGRRLTPQ